MKALKGREGWGEGLPSGPQPSHLSKAAALAAGRKPIGMWPLLVWAFQRELVRYSCGSLFRPRRVSQSSMAWAMAAGEAGERGGAEEMDYDFAPCCHADALEVYSAVLLVLDNAIDGEARRRGFQLLIKHPEAGTVPTWHVPPPQWKVRPVLNQKGKVRHLYGRRNEPIACEVDCVGVIDALGLVVRCYEDFERIRDGAVQRYAEWCALMAEVMHMLGEGSPSLKRFSINGLGVDEAPWEAARERAA